MRFLTLRFKYDFLYGNDILCEIRRVISVPDVIPFAAVRAVSVWDRFAVRVPVCVLSLHAFPHVTIV